MSISVRSLFHVYPSEGGNVAALRGLSLFVPDGQVCVMRGPNGSGKSTLIEVLSGRLTPSAGSVTVSNANGLEPRISIIRQFDNSIEDLTVREHLRLISKVKKDLTNAAIIKELKLDNVLDRQLRTLSMGERQLVAICQAMLDRPTVLLADEPTGALSPVESKTVYTLLTSVCRAMSTTLLMVTHDPAAEQFADRIVRIRDGRISEEWDARSPEAQVIDPDGWIRLPAESRTQFGRLVRAIPYDDTTELSAVDEPGILHSQQASSRTSPSGDTTISISGLTLSYNGEQPLFTQMNQAITSGSLTMVSGTSGAGKTSLLRILAGLQDEPTDAVKILDKAWAGMSRRKRALRRRSDIAMFTIDFDLGVVQSARTLGATDEIGELLELGDLISRPLNSLSGGQRQRALLAVALSHPTQILLLDEPTSALDDYFSHVVVRALIAECNRGRTIVMTTHNDDLLEYADHVISLGGFFS